MSEDLLEKGSFNDDYVALEGVKEKKILSLIGVAKPVILPSDLEDERLQYILSK